MVKECEGGEGRWGDGDKGGGGEKIVKECEGGECRWGDGDRGGGGEKRENGKGVRRGGGRRGGKG